MPLGAQSACIPAEVDQMIEQGKAVIRKQRFGHGQPAYLIQDLFQAVRLGMEPYLVIINGFIFLTAINGLTYHHPKQQVTVSLNFQKHAVA